MQHWSGIEHARHKGQEARERMGQMLNPISWEFAFGDSPRKLSRLAMTVNNDRAANRMFIASECITLPGGSKTARAPAEDMPAYEADRSMLNSLPGGPAMRPVSEVFDWNFFTLNPGRMGLPMPQQRSMGPVRLINDGSNVANFLLDLRQQDANAFNGIVETMAHVLPYAKDIQPMLTTSEIERKAWLQLSEQNFKVPGWLLSSGTLRLLALLALLRHPRPPPLISPASFLDSLRFLLPR